MKYVHYNNRGGCGFGNQMRSFAGALTLAKLTNRKLVVTDQYLTTAFKCPHIISNTDPILNKTQRQFTPSGIPHEQHMKSQALNDDLNFPEEIIKCGDGTDMAGNYLIKNPHYKEKYNNLLKAINGSSYYDYLTKYLPPSVGEPSNELANLAKKNIDYENNEYFSVQFRAFYDANNKFLQHLHNFSNKMLNVLEEQGAKEGKIFVTSDREDVTETIASKLTNFDVIKSVYPFRHSQDFSLESIADWLTIAKSKFSFSTGTSYATTAAVYTNKPMYIFDGKKDGYINKVFYQF
jgi:hypothetical protein